MVRKSSRISRVSSERSSKALSKKTFTSNSSSPASNINAGVSGNSVCKRETPSWQKPIGAFFKKEPKLIDEDKEEIKDSICIRGFYISKDDLNEAGCSHDNSDAKAKKRDSSLKQDKENLDSNGEPKRKIPVYHSNKTVRKMKPAYYKNLEKFESNGREDKKRELYPDSDAEMDLEIINKTEILKNVTKKVIE